LWQWGILVGVVPECPGVANEILIPRRAWTNEAAYDAAAEKLFHLFKQYFKKYEADPRATIMRDAAA
jgi:ATP-dependent phosphoenolpyruvate carboxykinase